MTSNIPADEEPRSWLVLIVCPAPDCPHSGEPVLKRRGQIYCSQKCHGRDRRAERGNHWKTKVGYSAQHKQVNHARGQPSLCEHCGTTEAARYEWAYNHTGDRNDVMAYVRLCKQCHADFDTDSQLYGNALYNSRLTEEIVREIRKRYAAGETYASLARELHVNKSTVQLAGNGKSWKWVK